MPELVSCLLFQNFQARDAANFYAATFPDSFVTKTSAAAADFPGGPAGAELTVEFRILGQKFLGLNGGPEIAPSPATSFQIITESQAETDRIWNAIIAAGGAENACGWCADPWGFSWQIVPGALLEALADENRDAASRAMQAMLTMRKIDIAKIEAARAAS